MNEKVKKKAAAAIKKTPGVSAIFEFFSRPKVISWAAMIGFMAIVMTSLFVSPRLFEARIHEGDVALRDIYAPYDFTYKWGVNEEKTQKAREEAMAEVPFFLERSEKAHDKARGRIDKFFDDLDSAREVEDQRKEEFLRKLYPNTFPEDAPLAALFAYHSPERLRVMLKDMLDGAYKGKIVTDETADEIRELGPGELMVKSRARQTASREELVSFKELEENFTRSLRERLSGRFDLQKAMLAVLMRAVEPEYSYDADHTEQRKLQAAEDTDPVYDTWSVKKNEIIISKGSRVKARDIARLTAMRRVFRPGITPGFFLGVLMMFALLGCAWWIYNFLFEKRCFTEDAKGLVIMLTAMLVMILLAHWIMRLPHPSYFIPLAGMGILLTLLVGFASAVIATSLVGVVIALLFGAGIEAFFVLMVAGFVGIYFARDARRRGQIIWAGIAAGAVKFLGVATIGFINNMPFSFFVNDGLWGLASGIFSAFLVLALLPVFEHVFKVPTNVTLVELSDLNHPLLKKLATEAPGTYHHSILVGNLAEAACDAIGANSLMARVGSYYHDIGKIDKAEYFNENEALGGPKHSNLAPTMSALIISQHVKKGLELARKYKLNTVIRDFIGQHHGESLISFFYQKALKDAGNSGKTLKDQDFRYPGPKPQTKEAAVVLLADSVEAATRSLTQATRSNIRNRVSKIVSEKFMDGQLEECDLTLRDMHDIQETFVKVLTSIYHKRMQYPGDKKVTQENGKSNAQDKRTEPGRENGS